MLINSYKTHYILCIPTESNLSIFVKNGQFIAKSLTGNEGFLTQLVLLVLEPPCITRCHNNNRV